MATRITAAQFQDVVLQAQVPVLVDFYSDSCTPCKRLSPVLAQLEATYGDRLSVVKVNVNYDTDLAENYAVHSVPTLLLFADGVPVQRLQGVVKQAEIEKILEPVIQEEGGRVE